MNEQFDQFMELMSENSSLKENCHLCKESNLKVGEISDYGACVIYKIGDHHNGWFATLSPKTGGDSMKDFTIQLTPIMHLTHFSQINSYPELANNYGLAFSRICYAMTKIMADEPDFKATTHTRESAASVATYGKCTTWKEKKEHLHIKIFPFKGAIGQPYTVDSTFEKKEIHKDEKTGKDFVKMAPVKKVLIDKRRFESLAQKLIEFLK